MFLFEVLKCSRGLSRLYRGSLTPTYGLESKHSLPKAKVCFDTDAGFVTIESLGERVVVSDEVRLDAIVVKWPSSALAQLVTGYQTAEVLSAIHNTLLSTEAVSLLDALFPQRWRFSRNEGWTFKS